MNVMSFLQTIQDKTGIAPVLENLREEGGGHVQRVTYSQYFPIVGELRGAEVQAVLILVMFKDSKEEEVFMYGPAPQSLLAMFAPAQEISDEDAMTAVLAKLENTKVIEVKLFSEQGRKTALVEAYTPEGKVGTRTFIVHVDEGAVVASEKE